MSLDGTLHDVISLPSRAFESKPEFLPKAASSMQQAYKPGRTNLDLYLTDTTLTAKHLPKAAIVEGKTEGGFFKELGHSAVHMLVQSPLEGVAQNFDQTIGRPFDTKLYEKTKDRLISAPIPAQFGSPDWHGQAIGAAVGIIPWFIVARSAMRGVAGNFAATRALVVSPTEAAANKELSSATGRKLVLEGGLSGATYSAAFKPVDSKEHFFAGKSRSMIKDFATFSTLTASSLYLRGRLGTAVKPICERSPLTSKLAPKVLAIGSGVGSAIPASVAELSSDYVLSGGKKELKAEDFLKSAYSFAFVGGTFGAFHPTSGGKDTTKPADRSAETMPPVDSGAKFPRKATSSTDLHSNEAQPVEHGKSRPVKPIEVPTITTSETTSNNHGSEPSNSNEASKFHIDSLAKLPEKAVAPKELNSKQTLAVEVEKRRPSEQVEALSISTSELASQFEHLPTAKEFNRVLGDKPVGKLPEAFVSGGLSMPEGFAKLDKLAQALRNLDAVLPPQKKSGLGAADLDLSKFNILIGDKKMTVAKIGIGEVAHVYKLSIDGKDYAFKVPNDPARLDVHGTLAETAAFVHLSKYKVNDIIDFYAANPGGKSGWMLTEYVDGPVKRDGVPVSSVLARENLRLGDDWSANRGPGNVVWDLGGIEPSDFKSPTNLADLSAAVKNRQGKMIAGRNLGTFADSVDMKEALQICLYQTDNPGQVARTAARKLTDPAEKAEVFGKALSVPGAAGRVAFELDTLANTPYITKLYYQALKNPESRVEAAKMIDKLPAADRKAAFDAAFAYPEARPMAARSIASIPDEQARADAVSKAKADPGAQFVMLQLASHKKTLNEAERQDRERSFMDYFESFGLRAGW